MAMPLRILGVDPGYGRVGWGIVEKFRGDITYIAHGCIETSPKVSFSQRLSDIFVALEGLISTYSPEVAAIEELFFAKNVTTGIQVAHARGVILLALHQANIPSKTVTPSQVKQSMTGYGRASKRQVQEMVKHCLHLKVIPSPDDAADALAVAFTASPLFFVEK